MAAKYLEFSTDARARLKRGVDQLADAVAAGDRIHEVADQLVGHFVQRHGPPGSPGRKSGPDWE